jgi:TetR/AcrR family transcriptional regulator, transcriptional repressor for nem operon
MSITRDDLVKAATELFLARGYSAVGTAELCRAADVNKGTFYHFFPSKASLLVAAITRYTDEFAAAFDAIARLDIAPAAKIAALFDVPERANRDWKDRHGHAQGCLVGNMTLELGRDEPEVHAATLIAFARWKNAIMPILMDYEMAGGPATPASEAAIDAEADRIIGLLQGGLLLAKAYDSPRHISAMAPVALAMLSARWETDSQPL